MLKDWWSGTVGDRVVGEFEIGGVTGGALSQIFRVAGGVLTPSH
jgi:hypothetical protein